MHERYLHFGWPVSPYSAKTRAYFRFKKLPFDDRCPTVAELMLRIRRKVGRPIMPTVLTPEGEWMQDTSEIIDALERRHPTPSIIPPGPTQRVASLLLELHGDEWLPTSALHYRWNVTANAAFALDEFAAYGFPRLPRRVGRLLVRPFAEKMRGYRSIVGIHPETTSGIERFTETLIAQLETHLAEHPFLLGGRPCLGDFALFGPLWAHMFRDPGTTHLFAAAPHVRAWFERLVRPVGAPGAFAPDDAVPDTLDPIFRVLFAEQFPFVRALVSAIDSWCDANPGAERVPRALGDHAFTIGGSAGQRRLVTFTQWMAQRPLAAYGALDDREAVDAWLARVGGRDAMQLEIRHPFERRGFHMRLAAGPR